MTDKKHIRHILGEGVVDRKKGVPSGNDMLAGPGCTFLLTHLEGWKYKLQYTGGRSQNIVTSEMSNVLSARLW